MAIKPFVKRVHQFRFNTRKIFLLSALLVTLLIITSFLEKYILHILILSAIWGISAIGWNICYGYAGLLSFGHIAFFGVGAYLTTFYLKFFDITPWAGIFLAAAIAGFFGLAIAWLTARSRGVYFALSTAAVPPILFVIFTWPWTWPITGGSLGLSLPYSPGNLYYMDFIGITPYWYISLAFILSILIAVKMFTRSKQGYYLKAIGQDEDAAKTLGIDTFRSRLIGMFISAFIVALAGGIYVIYFRFIDPYEGFGWAQNLQIILSAILGGVGTIIGPVIGAFLIVPMFEVTKIYLEGLFRGSHLVAFGIALMFVIYLMPEGVYPKVKSIFSKKFRGL